MRRFLRLPAGGRKGEAGGWFTRLGAFWFCVCRVVSRQAASSAGFLPSGSSAARRGKRGQSRTRTASSSAFEAAVSCRNGFVERVAGRRGHVCFPASSGHVRSRFRAGLRFPPGRRVGCLPESALPKLSAARPPGRGTRTDRLRGSCCRGSSRIRPASCPADDRPCAGGE